MAYGPPEMLMLAIDVGEEMRTPWDSRKPAAADRLTVVTSALVQFVKAKSALNPRHRFGITLLGDDAHPFLECTSDVHRVFESLGQLAAMVRPVADAFEFGVLLRLLTQELGLDRAAPGAAEPAPLAIDAAFTFRTIIVCVRASSKNPPSCLARALARNRAATRARRYGRSHAVPTLSEGTSTFKRLLEHPSFFIDALYVHKKPSEGGSCCQDVYDFLTKFEDASKLSYFFEVTASIPRLSQHTAMLLAHPCSRDEQDDMKMKLDECVALGS